MSRMLNALKRLDSRRPETSAPAPVPAAADRAVATEPEPPAEETASPQVAVAKAGSCDQGNSPRDLSAMESLLDESESATAAALEEDPGEPPKGRTETHSAPPADGEAEVDAGAPAGEAAEDLSREELPDPLSALAGNVLAAMEPGRPACFLFTSPDSNSLGIDLLVPLATSLSRRLDSELLLIDTNLRHPALAARLGVEASRGLTDVLNGASRWQDVVRHTVVAGVDLLPAVAFSTPAGPAPVRLELEPLLADARNFYGLILLHASSLQHPEAAPLAGLCDGAFLAVRLYETPRRVVADAVSVLQRAGAHLFGCVVVE